MACNCRPFIYTVNNAEMSVAQNGNLSLGTVVHQSCDECRLNGEGIVCHGRQAFEVYGIVILSVPSAESSATRDAVISLQQDNVNVPGGIAVSTLSSGTQIVTLPLLAVVRNDTKTSSVLTIQNQSVAPVSISKCVLAVKPLRQ